MKIFLLRMKQFVKRNIYPITVSVCTAFIIGIVAFSAYSSIKNSKQEVVKTNNKVEEIVDDKKEEKIEEKEETHETSSNDPIIFDLPFANAVISKEYTDSSLIYDATTKMWCTHQGLDFSCIEKQEVNAVYDGKIIKIESSMMNGTVVHLEVADGLVVVYKGLSSDVSVKEGDTIKKGSKIGMVTSFLTEKADGIHLHLEVLKNEKLVDPTEYFSFSK